MKCFGYCRVSTRKQKVIGLSLAAQRAKIEAFAELNDHELVEVDADGGVSGKAMRNRPALNRLLDLACEHQGVFVTYSMSRMSRSLSDLIKIVDRLGKSDAQFVSLTEHVDTTSANGRLIFNIMASFAQFEREIDAERTSAIIEYKRDRNEVIGNTPYGFERREGETEDDPALLSFSAVEMPQLQYILEASSAGYGYGDIARTLNMTGHRARSGRPWDRGVVRRIVLYHQTEVGAGLRESHDIRVDAPQNGVIAPPAPLPRS